MVRRIMAWLTAAGVNEVVMNLHYLPESIARVVGDGSDLGIRARYSWEQPNVLGSAGGVRQALDILGTDTFLLVNGDTLTDLDAARLVAAHRASGALVTMAVTPNLEPRRYSGLRVASDGSVTGVEPRGSSVASYHFIGAQVVQASAFARVPRGAAVNSVGGLYDTLIADLPGSVRACPMSARFWDIGTVADYWTTSHYFATLASAAPTPMDRHAHVVDSIIWDEVTFGDGACVERCIITDGVHVPANARYANSVLLRGTDATVVAIPFTPELT